jgi:hypothetical protein
VLHALYLLVPNPNLSPPFQIHSPIFQTQSRVSSVCSNLAQSIMTISSRYVVVLHTTSTMLKVTGVFRLLFYSSSDMQFFFLGFFS